MRPIPVYQEGAVCTGPAPWPDADFIVGNPPFLGSKMFRQHGLPEPYIQAMYSAFDLPNSSDLVCYWFELARRKIEKSPHVRAGLLATQGIRGGDNRRVLERIKDTGDIFMAWSDKEWVLDGAAVRVSIVAFAKSADSPWLDGASVAHITSNLSTQMPTAEVAPLRENRKIAFQGPVKVGDFDVSLETARQLLATPNPNSKMSSDVLCEWLQGQAINQRVAPLWIVDFGEREIGDAAGYEAVFERVTALVKPSREKSSDKLRRTYWWRLGRSGRDFRTAVGPADRYLASCQTAKHRIFVWARADTLPAQTVIAFARSDDYIFGVLHSSVHELWALRMGTQLESRPRYTPTTCFETFPLPWPPGKEPSGSPLAQAIAQAAKDLNEQREQWLNPPAWIDAIAKKIDAQDDFADVAAVSGEEARRLIRESAIMAAAAKDPKLKKRTLTNLYNERPTWLRLAHRRLDEAVLAAYASVDPTPGGGGWAAEWAQVWEDTGAGQPLPASHPLAAKRKEVDEAVLGALLALNLRRAGTGA